MKKLLRNAAWLFAFCGLAVSAYAQTCNDPITITTNTPLQENFNSYSASSSNSSIGGTELPPCWGSIVQSTTDYRPHIVTSSAYSYVSGFSSNYALMMCGSSTYGGSPTYLVLPGVTNDLATLKMSFQYKREENPTFQLGYLTSPTDGSTFQVIKNLTSTSGTEAIKFADLNISTTGTVYLAFKMAYSSSYYGAGVDDIVLEIAPDCPAPTNLTVTPFESIPNNPNKFSCYFSWTDATNAGSYKYAWVPQGSTVDWSSSSQTTSVGQNAVTPLDPQTSYDLYVMIDNCTTGGGVVAVAGPLTITTPCLPSPLPYTEDFEQMDATTSTYMYGGTISNTYFPDCWTIVPNSYTSYGSTYDCTPHVYSTNGNKCLIIGSGNSSISGIAALPPISGSLADMQILFTDKRYSTTGTLYLGYYANGTFTSLTTVTDGSADWTERSYNLGDLTGIANAPAGAQIAFKFSYSSNSSSYYALIDDITVQRAPDCPAPTDLSVTPFEPYTY
ncbi:MAG: hypothetical protein IJT04_02740, partial [Bacteroidales bacterium]|nr:hypothetical protein [Bacteroidales bacterium]